VVKGWLIISVVVVVFGLAFFTCYVAVIDPRVPTFGVKSATLISPNITSSRLIAELDIVFNVTNHNNWHKASYKTVSICLKSNMNNQSILASTYLEPFSQNKRWWPLKEKEGRYTKDKQVQLNMDVEHDEKTDCIARGFSNGMVDFFEIVLSTNVKLKNILGITSKVQSLKVVCNPISMSLNPGSSNWVLVHGLTCMQMQCN
jgi:hypothetical protein